MPEESDFRQLIESSATNDEDRAAVATAKCDMPTGEYVGASAHCAGLSVKDSGT